MTLRLIERNKTTPVIPPLGTGDDIELPANAGPREICRWMAERYYGRQGLWLCDLFEAVNEQLFLGELPYPHICIELTAWGHCLGYSAFPILHPDREPTILIHPTLFGTRSASKTAGPWGIPARWLGRSFVADVMVHECMHLSCRYRLRLSREAESHNNPSWIAEVNRLAPLIGFEDVRADMSKVRRMPIDGPLTKRGKQPTKPMRVTDGNIPYDIAARFPDSLRVHRQIAADWYMSGNIPVEM